MAEDDQRTGGVVFGGIPDGPVGAVDADGSARGSPRRAATVAEDQVVA
ncbi:hypothetical protein HMPREF0591_6332 [Mycobacterium parascrofulaceum ATCC BAA-614]|uniref:Uncharacterized protein n=1 Tax=Mycobacterium parascrofulaceum ATCC BAA-614 TaxID=525368 RepID=D5PJI8_9MYCO|nr:hypothetical protein HMPREF0591_6332 [Mycobacterium parascrofulaceum ATCC BAA-614]